MYTRMLISQRMNKHLLNMFSSAGSFDGDSILKIRLGAMLHGESQMNHVTSCDMYIYIYGPFHLFCVQVFSKEKGSTWTNHTPESYPRIIPQVKPFPPGTD